MRTYVEKPKGTPKTTSGNTANRARSIFAERPSGVDEAGLRAHDASAISLASFAHDFSGAFDLIVHGEFDRHNLRGFGCKFKDRLESADRAVFAGLRV